MADLADWLADCLNLDTSQHTKNGDPRKRGPSGPAYQRLASITKSNPIHREGPGKGVGEGLGE